MEIIDYVKNNDIMELNQLFQPIIQKYIKKYSWSQIDKDDFEQEAILAIIRAVKNYNPKKDASFGTYLGFWLHYYFGQYTMKNVNIIRPSSMILGEKTLHFSDSCKKSIDDYKNFSYVNIDDEDCEYQLCDEPEHKDREILKKELVKIAKKELPEKHFDALMKRCEGKTLSEIAKEYSLSKERIRQIEFLATSKVKEKIGELEI